jgi:hypothetical protein
MAIHKMLSIIVILLLAAVFVAVGNNNPDYVTILKVKSNIISHNNSEEFSIEKNADNSIRLSLTYTENNRKIDVPVDNTDKYNFWFTNNKGECVSLETTYLLSYLNHSVGFSDLDNDGIEEFYFLYSGASNYGLAIMDYVDHSLKVIGRIDCFIGFYKINNTLYLISKYFLTGPYIADPKINKYHTYKCINNKLKEYVPIPDDVYTFYYDIKTNNSEKDYSFYGLFMYIYNNRPKSLDYAFVDNKFKSDKSADNKYISKENVKRLINDRTLGGIDWDIYKSKYYYYYLIDTLK